MGSAVRSGLCLLGALALLQLGRVVLRDALAPWAISVVLLGPVPVLCYLYCRPAMAVFVAFGAGLFLTSLAAPPSFGLATICSLVSAGLAAQRPWVGRASSLRLCLLAVLAEILICWLSYLPSWEALPWARFWGDLLASCLATASAMVVITQLLPRPRTGEA